MLILLLGGRKEYIRGSALKDKVREADLRIFAKERN